MRASPHSIATEPPRPSATWRSMKYAAALNVSGIPSDAAEATMVAVSSRFHRPCRRQGSGLTVWQPVTLSRGRYNEGGAAHDPARPVVFPRTEAAVAQGSCTRLGGVSAAEGADARARPAHRVRRGALSEHRRVLAPRHG